MLKFTNHMCAPLSSIISTASMLVTFSAGGLGQERARRKSANSNAAVAAIIAPRSGLLTRITTQLTDRHKLTYESQKLQAKSPGANGGSVQRLDLGKSSDPPILLCSRSNNDAGHSFLERLFEGSESIRSSRGHRSNDPSSATRPTGHRDCNRDALAGFAAAHGVRLTWA